MGDGILLNEDLLSGFVLGRVFITDNGKEVPITDEGGKFVRNLERFAVWSYDDARCKHQVTEVSNDLASLQDQHPNAKVVPR